MFHFGVIQVHSHVVFVFSLYVCVPFVLTNNQKDKTSLVTSTAG